MSGSITSPSQVTQADVDAAQLAYDNFKFTVNPWSDPSQIDAYRQEVSKKRGLGAELGRLADLLYQKNRVPAAPAVSASFSFPQGGTSGFPTGGTSGYGYIPSFGTGSFPQATALSAQMAQEIAKLRADVAARDNQIAALKGARRSDVQFNNLLNEVWEYRTNVKPARPLEPFSVTLDDVDRAELTRLRVTEPDKFYSIASSPLTQSEYEAEVARKEKEEQDRKDKEAQDLKNKGGGGGGGGGDTDTFKPVSTDTISIRIGTKGGTMYWWNASTSLKRKWLYHTEPWLTSLALFLQAFTVRHGQTSQLQL